jgi:hypothetical protein
LLVGHHKEKTPKAMMNINQFDRFFDLLHRKLEKLEKAKKVLTKAIRHERSHNDEGEIIEDEFSAYRGEFREV